MFDLISCDLNAEEKKLAKMLSVVGNENPVVMKTGDDQLSNEMARRKLGKKVCVLNNLEWYCVTDFLYIISGHVFKFMHNKPNAKFVCDKAQVDVYQKAYRKGRFENNDGFEINTRLNEAIRSLMDVVALVFMDDDRLKECLHLIKTEILPKRIAQARERSGTPDNVEVEFSFDCDAHFFKALYKVCVFLRENERCTIN